MGNNNEQKRKSGRKIQRRPNPLLYYPVLTGMLLTLKLRYSMRISGVRRIKGPAIVLSNHPSNIDFMLVSSALYRSRINFMVSYYYYMNRALARILETVGCIPKHQFAPDAKAMRRVGDVLKKRGGVVGMMAEGAVYGNGRTNYINPVIVRFLRHFAVPVYAARVQGSGLCFPKWAKESRRGKIEVEVTRLFDFGELEAIGDDEAYRRITEALGYDEFAYAARRGLTYRGKAFAEGLENMLVLCPVCGREFTLTTSGDRICCSACGAAARMDKSQRFVWESGEGSPDNFSDWYDYQLEHYRRLTEKEDFRLSSRVELYTDRPEQGASKYVRVGEGRATMDANGVRYVGTKDGAPVEYDDPMSVIPALPFTYEEDFELPYCKGVRSLRPEQPKEVIKWVLCHRAICDRRA